MGTSAAGCSTPPAAWTPVAGRTWSPRPRPPRLPTGRPRATPSIRSAWASAPSWSPRATSPGDCGTWRWRCWPRARSSSRRRGRPGELGYAVLGCVPDRGCAELLVGLELGCVVQLLGCAVAGESGMALGIGDHVPRCAGPPAELAHPDVAFGGQPRDGPRPAEPAVCPRVDDLARGQAAPAAHHRGGVELDVDPGVGPGQRDGTAEGEP